MKHPAVGLAIVGLGASLAPLDIAVNVALPAITAHFRLALGDVQWLVICYVLVYGSLMLVCGKLGDLLSLVYTGSYMVRHIDGQQDYSNYMRSFSGSYNADLRRNIFGVAK